MRVRQVLHGGVRKNYMRVHGSKAVSCTPASYVMCIGATRQTSCAYSRMVRSLENLPIFVTFRIDILVDVAWSRYVSATRAWHAT